MGISVFDGPTYGNVYDINPTIVTDNIWRHITWTINPNGTSLFYINGILVNTFNCRYPPSVNRNINFFGTTNFGVPTFKGGIDDFRIYNGILSQTEITSLYN